MLVIRSTTVWLTFCQTYPRLVKGLLNPGIFCRSENWTWKEKRLSITLKFGAKFSVKSESIVALLMWRLGSRWGWISGLGLPTSALPNPWCMIHEKYKTVFIRSSPTVSSQMCVRLTSLRGSSVLSKRSLHVMIEKRSQNPNRRHTDADVTHNRNQWILALLLTKQILAWNPETLSLWWRFVCWHPLLSVVTHPTLSFQDQVVGSLIMKLVESAAENKVQKIAFGELSHIRLNLKQLHNLDKSVVEIKVCAALLLRFVNWGPTIPLLLCWLYVLSSFRLTQYRAPVPTLPTKSPLSNNVLVQIAKLHIRPSKRELEIWRNTFQRMTISVGHCFVENPEPIKVGHWHVWATRHFITWDLQPDWTESDWTELNMRGFSSSFLTHADSSSGIPNLRLASYLKLTRSVAYEQFNSSRI